MATRNVVLTEHQDKLIAALVKSGQYQNASEVIREGIRLVESRRRTEKKYENWLAAEAKKGIESFGRGEYQSFNDAEEMIAYLDTYLDEKLAFKGNA